MRGLRNRVWFNMVCPLGGGRLPSRARHAQECDLTVEKCEVKIRPDPCGLSTMPDLTRRRFLQSTAAGVPALTLGPPFWEWQAPDPWTRADALVRSIVVPTFAARDCDITKYGAVGDGK